MYRTPLPPKMSSAEPMGQIDAPLPEPRRFLEVGEAAGAAGVGHRDGRPPAEPGDQLAVDAAAETLHIDGVDKKLRAAFGQLA